MSKTETPEEAVERLRHVESVIRSKQAGCVPPSDMVEMLQARQERYGKFDHLASIAQSLKRILRDAIEHEDHRGFTHVQREAIDMIVSKLSRIVCGDPHYADSWDDIAGYATLVAEKLRGRNL